ncbi:MAG: OmpH family outer membrane protein [Gemmataceae bacterium]
MKKTVLAVGSFLVLGVFCYIGRLSVQGQAPQNPQAAATQPTPARTRIALLNLTYVIKNYDKYKHFQEQIKGIVEPFQNKDKSLRLRLEELAKKVEANPSLRDDMERQAKDIKRQIEDNSGDAKIQLGKRSDDEMKILFLDVYEAVQRYAVSHDFELVLHYNDAVTKEDFLGARNIARKLNTGALMPLYFTPSMDISMDVVRLLNSNVSAPSAGATPTGGGQH